MGEDFYKGKNHCYEIRIKNHLDAYWADWFDGWTITNLENGEVILFCPDADHAAIHGVLDKIRDLNLTLISVRQADIKPRADDPHQKTMIKKDEQDEQNNVH